MDSFSGLAVQALISLGLVLPAFLGGMFARRKSAADVEVTLSAEARQWAQSFADGARTATDAARNAMEQAREAKQEAEQAKVATRDCHRRVDAMQRHINRLDALLVEHGITPPEHPWGSG